MEKYSRYRDKGTGIAPFFPIAAQPSGIYLPFHIFLFIVRVPILFTVICFYLLIFSWLPIGSLGKKAVLWVILGIPGIWWIDIRIDGIPQLPTQPPPPTLLHNRLLLHLPLDALYLAAIFDPIFTTSYPTTPLLQHISLSRAIIGALLPPLLHPPSANGTPLTTLSALRTLNPSRAIVVLPECTTTNGRAILPLSPSLLTAPPSAKIYPTSLHYAPPDITTPIPGWRAGCTFLWNLCSRPTHTIRVRIAEPVYNTASIAAPAPKTKERQETVGVRRKTSAAGTLAMPTTATATATATALKPPNSYATNFLDTLGPEYNSTSTTHNTAGPEDDNDDDDDDAMSIPLTRGAEDDDATLTLSLTSEGTRVLDKIGEALARLGRVKRVGLGVKEKADFLAVWNRKRR